MSVEVLYENKPLLSLSLSKGYGVLCELDNSTVVLFVMIINSGIAVDLGNYKEVSAGFGNNVWAIISRGYLYKKENITSVSRYLSDWRIQLGTEVKKIRVGIGGVFILDSDGKLWSLRGKSFES